MASEIRVNKIENRSGLGTVTFADTGVDLAGIVTATTFSGSGASLTSLPAASLTGTVADARFPATLPATSAANLTNVPAANVVGVHTSLTVTNSTTTGTAVVGGGVTISESGIEASGIGITCTNINGDQIGGRRNVIINGAMQVAQRGTSFTITGGYTLDRWRFDDSMDSGAATVTQSTTSPDGFSNSLKVDITTADTSLAGNDYSQVYQYIEAQNLQHLAYGTSAAKTITISFYVRSNKTGGYNVAFLQDDASSRLASFQYTINSADTWERKSFTIPGDASGQINNDTGIGFSIFWGLSYGGNYTSGSLQSSFSGYVGANFAPGQSVNLYDSTSNEWYITGVQLEIGPQATPFEHRSFGEELALCQRYYYVVADGRDSGSTKQLSTGMAYSNNQVETVIHYPVMRSNPSLVQGSGTDYFKAVNGNNSDLFNNYIIYHPSPRAALIYRNQLSVTEGQAYRLELNENDAYIHLSAEL